MSAAPYQVYFPESLNSPIKLMSQGKSYEFTLKEMSYNAGEDYLDSPQLTSAVIGDKKVIYPEAFENMSKKVQKTLKPCLKWNQTFKIVQKNTKVSHPDCR
jgi:hypothetical protein